MLPAHEDRGPWFVRVIENKVAVGIFTCTEYQLSDLIDEVTDPDACEYKKLSAGGFIFEDDPVLHQVDEEQGNPDLGTVHFTESWGEIYENSGLWRRLDTPFFDNDE